MAEGAALLVDHVLPAVGYRQWVLSFSGPLAVRLGYDQALLATVAESLARAVMQDMRWAVKERHGLNYLLQGRRADAERLFLKLAGLCNDVGLLSEEYDPVQRRFLGNFPQAFSHIALVDTAINLSRRGSPADDRSHVPDLS